MKNNLIICNTYYQLLFAMQMQRTIKNNENVYVIISDHSNDSYNVYLNTKKTGIFMETFYVPSKKIDNLETHLYEKIFNILSMIFGYGKKYKLTLPKIDEIIFFNYCSTAYTMFARLYRINPQIICSRYEESMISYNWNYTLNRRTKIVKNVRKKLNKRNIFDDIKYFYCFEPNLYNGYSKAIKVPLFSEKDKEISDYASKIFNMSSKKIDYPQKYIFFTSPLEDIEVFGQDDIINEIIKIVGINNLIIKVHPRESIEKYKKFGCIIDDNSSLPWEAIQLNYDFSNHIFLTILSTSIITLSSIFNNPPTGVYLYNLGFLKRDNISDLITNFNNRIQSIMISCKSQKIFIPTSINDLTKILL